MDNRTIQCQKHEKTGRGKKEKAKKREETNPTKNIHDDETTRSQAQIEGDIIEEEKNQYKVGQSHKAGLLLDDTTSQTRVSETNKQKQNYKI